MNDVARLGKLSKNIDNADDFARAGKLSGAADNIDDPWRVSQRNSKYSKRHNALKYSKNGLNHSDAKDMFKLLKYFNKNKIDQIINAREIKFLKNKNPKFSKAYEELKSSPELIKNKKTFNLKVTELKEKYYTKNLMIEFAKKAKLIRSGFKIRDLYKRSSGFQST